MRVLVVEDDLNKCSQILHLLAGVVPDATLEAEHSFKEAQVRVQTEVFDLLILDMTLPMFGQRAAGGAPQNTGGRYLFEEALRRGADTRAVFVTQYVDFDDGIGLRTLPELRSELRSEFPDLVLGVVEYSATDDLWQQGIRDALRIFDYE